MFANFAAKRHFNGPLKAVSPVADDFAEVDWKLASKMARKSAEIPSDVSANSRKLINYLNKSFQGKAPKEFVSIKEGFELFLVEAVSLFVPLFYIIFVLGLLGITCFFFSEPMIVYLQNEDYLHATYWACPAVLSIGLLYVLLRPIFGGFRSYHGRVLLQHEAPALFELVDKMSQHLGVKPPKRIEVNNETALRVDAYSGVNSIYRDEYKLIIGMPLIMSLSLNELAAMIAHEIAHFRSKHKKVAFYLMHHVSEWLYFRATGQDHLYQKLLQRMQKERLPKYEYIELWCWQRVYLIQQSLFMLLFQSHRRLTAWKCRQIEFETDLVACQVSGEQAFKDMFRGVRTAQYAQKAVSLQNDWAWKDGYLLDDYGLAVSLEAKKIPSSALKAIEEGYGKTISYFCPNDLERMTNIVAGNHKGVLKANVEARFLFEDVSKLSKDLTLLDYEANGIKDALNYCVSSEKIRKLKQVRDLSLVSAKHYFDGRGDNRILKFEPSHERDVLQFDVQSSINYIRDFRVEDRKYQASANNLFKRIEKTYILERLRASKLPVHKYVPQDVAPRKEAQGYLQYMQEQYQKLMKQMEYMDQVYYQRAHQGLNVLDRHSRNKIIQAFHNLELYCQVRHELDELTLASKPLKMIVHGLTAGANTRILQAAATEKRITWDLIQTFRSKLGERPVKVALHGKPVHILTYLDCKLGGLPVSSSDMSIMAMAEYLHQLLELLTFQYNKWLGQLAGTLIGFERQNGISQVNLLHRH